MKPRIIAQAVTASFFAAAAATPAFAENIYETGLGLGVWTNMTIPLGTQAWFLGQQYIDIDGTSFMAFCLDPAQYSPPAPPPTYVYTPMSLPTRFSSGTTAADVETLYAKFYTPATLASATQSAAFQWALWEIANDDFNTATGGVKLTGSTDASVLAATNSMLSFVAAPGNMTSAYTITVHVNDVKQDYITAVPVPEPETYAMFLAGLGMMGVVARRRIARRS